jgi:hypothetical protein
MKSITPGEGRALQYVKHTNEKGISREPYSMAGGWGRWLFCMLATMLWRLGNLLPNQATDENARNAASE